MRQIYVLIRYRQTLFLKAYSYVTTCLRRVIMRGANAMYHTISGMSLPLRAVSLVISRLITMQTQLSIREFTKKKIIYICIYRKRKVQMITEIIIIHRVICVATLR